MLNAADDGAVWCRGEKNRTEMGDNLDTLHKAEAEFKTVSGENPGNDRGFSRFDRK